MSSKKPLPPRPEVCQAEDCQNPLVQVRTNRIRFYCSPACQKRQKRREHKLRLQGYKLTDITPRPVELDTETLLKRAMKDLEKKLDRNGVKELVDRLDKILDYQKEQQTKPKEVDQADIRTTKQRDLAKRFADWLAQQADA